MTRRQSTKSGDYRSQSVELNKPIKQQLLTKGEGCPSSGLRGLNLIQRKHPKYISGIRKEITFTYTVPGAVPPKNSAMENKLSRSTVFLTATRRSTPWVNKIRCHTTEDDDATVHIMAYSPPLNAFLLPRTYDSGEGFPVFQQWRPKKKLDFLAKKHWEKPVNITLHNFDTRGRI